MKEGLVFYYPINSKIITRDGFMAVTKYFYITNSVTYMRMKALP
jgi:hypothetical protein